MTISWFVRGLFAGIRTERLPSGADISAGLSPGMPAATTFSSSEDAKAVAGRCPTAALEANGTSVEVQAGKCVLCMRCGRGEPKQQWRHDLPPAQISDDFKPLPKGFTGSIHVRIVDAGDCGACLNELAQINGPSYNLHRFGIFITPTPRQADVLLVVGPVTTHMQAPLRAAYEAMPEPKRVVAVGACAASGGIFGPSIVSGAGVADAVPVDVTVPGCPPPPIAIIQALRTVCAQVRPS
jgi:Ni,Fe-hydrogenase III small subunit